MRASRLSDIRRRKMPEIRSDENSGNGQMCAGGEEGASLQFSKQRKTVHKRLPDPGGQAPRPPTDRRNDAVATLWLMTERRSRMR